MRTYIGCVTCCLITHRAIVRKDSCLGTERNKKRRKAEESQTIMPKTVGRKTIKLCVSMNVSEKL